MKRAAAIVAVLVAAVLCWSGTEAAASPQRDKIFSKFNRWVVTTWFGPEQMAALMDKMEPQITPNVTQEQLKKSAMTTAMGVLDGGQYTKIIGIGSAFLFKFGGFTQAIEIISNSLYANVEAFAEQLKAVGTRNWANNVPPDEQFVQFYTLIDQFMTSKRVGTIWCRAKNAYDRNNTKYWPQIQSSFNGILQFPVYDLSCCKPGDFTWDATKCPITA